MRRNKLFYFYVPQNIAHSRRWLDRTSLPERKISLISRSSSQTVVWENKSYRANSFVSLDPQTQQIGDWRIMARFTWALSSSTTDIVILSIFVLFLWSSLFVSAVIGDPSTIILHPPHAGSNRHTMFLPLFPSPPNSSRISSFSGNGKSRRHLQKSDTSRPNARMALHDDLLLHGYVFISSIYFTRAHVNNRDMWILYYIFCLAGKSQRLNSLGTTLIIILFSVLITFDFRSYRFYHLFANWIGDD